MDSDALPILPSRDAKGHKGTFGTVCVFGGCAAGASDGPAARSRMIGGPALSAIAALRVGAGLARLAMPEPVLDAGLTIAPSATGVRVPVDREGMIVGHEAARVIDEVALACECIAIGPGLGGGGGARAAAVRAVGQEDCPVVVDADAINNLCDVPELRRDLRAGAVFTPHPGEFRRLADALGVTGDPTGDDDARTGAAERLAQSLGCVVVLKGARTVVSDGHRAWIDSHENPCLATAGTGDVLTGAIAGLIAQHHRKPIIAGSRTVTSERMGGLSLYDCARLGVRAHALAAAAWSRSHQDASGGMLAMELADLLPEAVEGLRG